MNMTDYPRPAYLILAIASAAATLGSAYGIWFYTVSGYIVGSILMVLLTAACGVLTFMNMTRFTDKKAS